MAKAKEKPNALEMHYKAELVPIDSIQPNAWNPNKMSADEQASLAYGIEQDGFIGAVVCQKKSRNIINGEHRWRDLKEKGQTHIPVIFLDVDDAEAQRLTLSLNIQGSNDREKLTSLLRVLVNKKTNLDNFSKHVGLDRSKIESLLSRARAVSYESTDTTEENTETVDGIEKGKRKKKNEAAPEYDSEGVVVVAPGVDPKVQYPVVFYAPNSEILEKLKAVFGSKHTEDFQVDKLLTVTNYWLSKHPAEQADVDAAMATVEEDPSFGDTPIRPTKKKKR